MYSKGRMLCLCVVGCIALCTSAVAQTPDELMAIRGALDQALNAHDFDQMMAHFAEDAVFDFVPSPVPMSGKQEIRAFFEDLPCQFFRLIQ